MTAVSDSSVAFAEKLLDLLDRGQFTATYKYAVLLGILDLVLEKTSFRGDPPEEITTRELAEKILTLYWPHTLPFEFTSREPTVLRQNKGRYDSQAEIVSRIDRFRSNNVRDATATYYSVRSQFTKQSESLLDQVEQKLIEMPLPRLQKVGSASGPFIYNIDWDEEVDLSAVRRYQKGEGGFDPTIRFAPGVPEQLRRLNSILRPLIQRQWAAQVAQINGLEESSLEKFLFGADREPTGKVRSGLIEINAGRCFYCNGKLGGARSPEIDHFIPWSRFPNNAIENLVVAHSACNRSKRNFLVAHPHLEHWASYINENQSTLHELALEQNWRSDIVKSTGVISAIYQGLPDDYYVWVRGNEFQLIDIPGAHAAIQSVSL